MRIAGQISYPVHGRPSYVLGGRSMQIVYDETGLLEYMRLRGQSLAETSGLNR